MVEKFSFGTDDILTRAIKLKVNQTGLKVVISYTSHYL